MPDYDAIRRVKDFETLVEYLRDELDWPFDMEIDDVEDLAFEYEPDELGLDKGYEVKVREIKQLRPPGSGNQPWGIFYVDFETKRLPVVVLRRALRALVPKKRSSAASSHQATWEADDLLFIAATGETGNRGISFAHFEKNEGGQPRLKTVSWDEQEMHFFYLKQNIARLRWPEDEDDTKAWREGWASAFPTEHREVIKTSKELSAELARLARKTRELIREVYGYEARDGSLHKLHESFRTVLIEDLGVDSFADMVAQTISYGLFSARATGEAVLGLAHLEAMVPNTNPFLKELFAEFVSMSGTEKHQIDFDELGVSELVEMLNEVNVEAVLQDFGKQTGGGTQDPVIYFYEEFLKDYDKDQKVKRGEFYTPKPVVSYIVRSVDRILRDELGCPDGLADTSEMEWNGRTWPKVMILDPATGTGTFLETVIDVIYETMTLKWKKEGRKQDEIHVAWNEYVPEHLLPRLHGFELMMAPYSVAHMKLGLKLKETGYEFESKKRLQVYLTNTLEEPQDFSGRLYADFLAHEAEAANRVKREVPVTVVIGNPPYSAISANLRPAMRRMVADYRFVDGVPIKEKGALQFEKNINDDYVKFIRFAQNALSSREGIAALITNNSFLEAITLRGMRSSLMDTFSRIDIVDLHGSADKHELAADGSADENVFDIKQGVGISIMVRGKNENANGKASVRRYDLLGREGEKLAWLKNVTSSHTPLLNLVPYADTYLFKALDKDLACEYRAFSSIPTLLSVNSTGFESGKDEVLTSFTAHELEDQLHYFSLGPREEVKERFKIKQGWGRSVFERRKTIADDPYFHERIQKFVFGPFDLRYTFYRKDLLKTNSFSAGKHLVYGSNLSLVVMRQVSVHGGFSHVGISYYMPNNRAFYSTKGKTSYFPLYLYSGTSDLIQEEGEWLGSNFAPGCLKNNADALGLKGLQRGLGDLTSSCGPEDVLHYSYALLHSNVYRQRYAPFLENDFPRVPFTTDLGLFRRLAGLGADLVALHLLDDHYPGATWNLVDGSARTSSVCVSTEERMAAGITGVHSPLHQDIVSFYDGGDRTISRVGEKQKTLADVHASRGRLFINPSSYFDNVPENIWNFRVGGYQPCFKWLKDRKGRTLTPEDVKHYTKVVAALHETSQIMREIDEVIEAHGGWPLLGSVSSE